MPKRFGSAANDVCPCISGDTAYGHLCKQQPNFCVRRLVRTMECGIRVPKLRLVVPPNEVSRE